MDPISDILDHLDFAGMFYFTTEFSGPWGMRVPKYEDVIRFHLVTRGECYVRVGEEGTPALIRPGDFFMIPHGAQHDLLARPDLPAPPLETVFHDAGYSGEGPFIYNLGDKGEATRLVCGHFSFAPGTQGSRFLSALPSAILVRQMPGGMAGWITATLDVLANEQDQPGPGQSIVVHRMTEVLFVQALRQWMGRDDVPAGTLKGLGDPQISRALSALHATPERDWAVADLARIAGLSRTVFAERFHARLGLPPLKYLTDWRMQKAHRLLKLGALSVDAIARDVGYQSTPAFSRTYARQFGEGPGATRRSAQNKTAQPA